MPFPWMLVAQIALSVGSIILGRRNVEQGKLDDVNVDTGSYGRELPVVLGEQQVVGQTIWIAGNQLIEEKKTKRKPPLIGSKITTYTYYANFAVALTCNKVKLVKVWANDTLIIDLSGTSTGGLDSDIRYEFKDGSDTQTTSSFMSNPNSFTDSGGGGGLFGALFGALFLSSSSTTYNSNGDAGNTSHPAYNGISYLIFDRLKLEKFGNAIPTIKAQVVEAAENENIFTDLGNLAGAVATIDNHDRVWLASNQTFRAYSASTGMIEEQITVDVGTPSSFLESVFYHESANMLLFSGSINSPRLYGANALSGDILYQSPSAAHAVYWNAFDGVNAVTTALNGTVTLLSVTGGGELSVIDTTGFSGFSSQPRAVFGGGFYLAAVDESGTRIKMRSSDGILTSDRPASDYGFTGSIHITFHKALNSFLIIGAGAGIVKIDTNGNEIQSSTGMSLGENAEAAKIIYQYAPEKVWFRSGNDDLVEIDMRTLEVVRGINIHSDVIGDPIVSVHGVLPLPAVNALFVRTNVIDKDYGIIYLDRPPSTNLTVKHCVEEITSRLGIPMSKIDATVATREIKGLTVSGASSRRAIEQLLEVTGYDLIEEDGILRIIDRGSAPVMAIDMDALGEMSDEFRLERSIGREAEMPWKAELSFADFDGDFESNVAIASTARDAVNTNAVLKIDAPLSLTVDQAKTYVERILGQQIRERANVAFKLPMQRYARLSAGDVVTVPDGNDSLNVRISRISGVDVLQVEGVIDDPTGWNISLSGTSRNVPVASISRLSNNSQPVVVDSALPVDDVAALDGLGLSSSSIPIARPVGTLEYHMSSDGGDNYVLLENSGGEPLVLRTLNTLTDVSNPAIMDNAGEIKIAETDAIGPYEFNEIAQYPFLNLAFVQAGGDWELIQFQNVINNGDGTITLSGLLRGLRGTEHLTGLHGVGDLFVLFNDGYVRGAGTADLGLERHFVGILEDVDNPVIAIHTPTLESLRPYSPVDIEFSHNGTYDAVITWRRRTRLGANDLDGNDVPLSETSENYEIDIEDSGSSIVRTLTSTSETVTYTVADQIADLGGQWTAFTAIVYQISDEYGRGIGERKYFENLNTIILAEISQLSADVIVAAASLPKVSQAIAEVIVASESDPKVSQVIAEVITD